MKVSDIYSSITQMMINAENVTWNRFNSYLIANSIFLIFWVTLLTSDSITKYKLGAMVGICLIGVLGGIFFSALGYRGRCFLDQYVDMGQRLEKKKLWPIKVNVKPFTETEKLIHIINYGWAGSRYILSWTPIIFTLFYGVLILISVHEYITQC